MKATNDKLRNVTSGKYHAGCLGEMTRLIRTQGGDLDGEGKLARKKRRARTELDVG
jgi:hypothetical protein